MKLSFSYFTTLIKSLNKWTFLLTSIWVAVFITINFTIGIESRIQAFPEFYQRFSGFFLLYLLLFGIPYWIHFTNSRNFIPLTASFVWLFISAPLLFALKMSHRNFAGIFLSTNNYPWYEYGKWILNWPLNSLLLLLLVVFIWKWAQIEGPVAGLSTKKFSLKPYLILLGCMIPLIAFAGTQADFLHTYPKVKNISFLKDHVTSFWPYQLLYELSYGSDFFSIEFFFRGFLVLGFLRFAGKEAILPMAAFYCSIHFGKPLLECITSYFGGIILGVIVYRTKSIWGGLLIHLGIAWMMEVVASV